MLEKEGTMKPTGSGGLDTMKPALVYEVPRKG
jgi:hypothetical protein